MPIKSWLTTGQIIDQCSNDGQMIDSWSSDWPVVESAPVKSLTFYAPDKRFSANLTAPVHTFDRWFSGQIEVVKPYDRQSVHGSQGLSTR
jgi:hypothetical protein